jgi:hypothetical protein
MKKRRSKEAESRGKLTVVIENFELVIAEEGTPRVDFRSGLAQI